MATKHWTDRSAHRILHCMRKLTTLFDLDDTLYPTSLGLQEAISNRILDYIQLHLGISLDGAQALRHHYFTTYGTTMRGLQVNHGVTIERFLAFVHDVPYAAYLKEDPVLSQLLGLLHGNKAIFTNSPAEHTHIVLRHLGITEHFGTIFDIRFQQFLPKPHLHGYQKALATLDITAETTIMVEDTLHNLQTARELGMTTIFITDSPPPAGHPADYVVPDIYAALHVILELQG